MVSKKEWGNSVWNCFHILSYKVNNDILNKRILMFFSEICKLLPCPVCSSHATQLIHKFNLSKCMTKKNLIDFFYVFHNEVNKKTNKPVYSYLKLQEYSKGNLIQTFNNMVHKLTTNVNFTAMAENMHRKNLLNTFRTFLITNIRKNLISN